MEHDPTTAVDSGHASESVLPDNPYDTSAAVRGPAVIAFLGTVPTQSAPRMIDMTHVLETRDGNALSASDDELHPAVAALVASGISPADTKARLEFHVAGDVDPVVAVCAYAAFCGFAGRRVPIIIDGSDRIEAGEIEATARAAVDAGRPEHPADVVQFGAPHPECVSLVGALGPFEVSALRFARRVRLALLPQLSAALAQFVVVAGWRARGTHDRFPQLVLDPTSPLDDPDVIDLDALRRAAAELRQANRSGALPLAERVDPPANWAPLVQASQLPPLAVVVALGSLTDGSGLWRCPRPERHTNGDKVPSMRVDEHASRCFRCDAEWVDPVRLVADVHGCSAFEAATWLLDTVAPRVDDLIADVPNAVIDIVDAA